MLAEKLTESLGSKLLACFIHEVVPVHETASRLRKNKAYVSEEEARAWPSIWKQQRIYLAKDYISLAAEVRIHIFKCLSSHPSMLQVLYVGFR